MMSAPNTMSGRSARTLATNSSVSARKCRRFMRLRIMSSPDCRLRCRCGISRRSRRQRIVQRLVGLDRIDRRNPEPRQVRDVAQDRLHQLAEARLARQIGAITM